MSTVNNLEQLTTTIHQTNKYFLNKAQKQVNTAMTLRNWLIGCHIIEYEQLGEDRAVYGQKVLETLAARLKAKGLKGMAETNLKLFRQFYNLYPKIRQTVSDEFKGIDLQIMKISQAMSDQLSHTEVVKTGETIAEIPATLLANHLSFSHFIELLKADTEPQRRFYEAQAINNNWGVRD
jgi:dGTP triphosphohydrolase